MTIALEDNKAADLANELAITFVHMVSEFADTGKASVGSDPIVMQLVERGVCFLDYEVQTHNQVAVLKEPLVLAAALNVFDLSESLQDTMKLLSNFPSAMGFIWEPVLALSIAKRYKNLQLMSDPLIQLLDPTSLKALDFDKRFIGTCTFPLCESFGQSGNKLGDVGKWLKVCHKAITDKALLPSWVFYPEEAAGPDLVFWLKVDEKFHVVFLQAKLKESVDAHDAYRTTIPESTYVTKGKGGSEFKLSTGNVNANSMVKSVVRDTEVVASVVRMIIAYPAPLTLLSTSFPAPSCEGVHANCHPDSAVKDFLMVVRGGQDTTNNAAMFFSKSQLELLKQLKGKGGK